MKKYIKIVYLIIIIILVIFIYLSADKKSYNYLDKETHIDYIDISIEMKYKCDKIAEWFRPKENKFVISYDLKIENYKSSNTLEIRSDAKDSMISKIYIIKDYENEDFITYNISYSFIEDDKMSYKNLENILYLKKENSYLPFYSWEIMLPKILIEHNYDKYTTEYMNNIIDNRLTIEFAIENGLTY